MDIMIKEIKIDRNSFFKVDKTESFFKFKTKWSRLTLKTSDLFTDSSSYLGLSV